MVQEKELVRNYEALAGRYNALLAKLEHFRLNGTLGDKERPVVYVETYISDREALQIEHSKLTKQYQDLQNQFLVAETRYADKVAECSVQQDTIEKLTRQLSSHRRNSSLHHGSQLAELSRQQELLTQMQELQGINEKLKKKSSQDGRDMTVMEERICQLDTHNCELSDALHEQKGVQSLLSATQTELNDARTKIATIEAVLTATQTEVSTLEGMIADMRLLPEASSPAAFDVGSERQCPLSSTVSKFPNFMQDAQLFETILSQELNEELSHKSGNGPVLDTKLPATLLRKSAVEESSTSRSDRHITACADYTSNQHHAAEMQKNWKLHSLLLSENLEKKLQRHGSRPEKQRVGAILQQLSVWRAQEAELDHYRELAKGEAETIRPYIESDKNENDSRDASMLSLDYTSASTTQHEILRLLRKQDAIIKSYRQKFEFLQKNQSYAAIKEEQSIKDQKFKMYRRTAEERIARLKQENTLVAKAFYDLAGRLQQSNLSLQRANSAPRTFLSQARAASSLTMPQPHPH